MWPGLLATVMSCLLAGSARGTKTFKRKNALSPDAEGFTLLFSNLQH